ncbi:MAG TPA: DUF3105 domain-containing protein [Polyangiaceae bacterium]|nr:DUF3105 domain-containing protein [Polyangiaceae bacterium]
MKLASHYASYLALACCLGSAMGACSAGDKSSGEEQSRGGSSSNTSHGGTNNAGGSANNTGGDQDGSGEAGQTSEGGGGAMGTGDQDAGSAGSSAGGTPSDPDSGGGGATTVGDGSACNVETATHESEGAFHFAECTVMAYQTNPPSSGNHYNVWAAFGVYEFPLPRGYWVHNLEHGAVVISYNCPEGCDADLQAAVAWFNALPVDSSCQLQGAPQPRALLVPDPLLDVRFAASSWLHTLRADCFDEVAFGEFYESNVGHGLENVCSPGAEFRGPDGSATSALPAGCGQ